MRQSIHMKTFKWKIYVTFFAKYRYISLLQMLKLQWEVTIFGCFINVSSCGRHFFQPGSVKSENSVRCHFLSILFFIWNTSEIKENTYFLSWEIRLLLVHLFYYHFIIYTCFLFILVQIHENCKAYKIKKWSSSVL